MDPIWWSISDREESEVKARKSAVKKCRKAAGQSGLINVNNSEYINFLEEDWCIDTKNTRMVPRVMKHGY